MRTGGFHASDPTVRRLVFSISLSHKLRRLDVTAAVSVKRLLVANVTVRRHRRVSAMRESTCCSPLPPRAIHSSRRTTPRC